MKIRNDFITNSSSSSYVILLNKDIKDLTKDETRSWLIPKYQDIAEMLCEDLKTHCREINFNDFVDECSNEIYGRLSFDDEEYCMTWQERRKLINYYATEIARARMQNYKKIYETRDYDGSEGTLEKIMDYNSAFEKRENIVYVNGH